MIQKLLRWKSLRFEDKIQALEELSNHPSKEAIMESICNKTKVVDFIYNLYEEKVEEMEEKIRDL